jgi:hypothetical protein
VNLRRFSIVLVLAVMAAPAVALAVATPLSPVNGSVVASVRPLLMWTVPTNERADAVFISTSPVTVPAGYFREADIVDAGYFVPNDVVEYSPRRALYAGRYWWQVETSDLTTYQVSYSVPTDFRVPARTNLLGLRLTRQRGRVSVDVSWSTNTRLLAVQERVSRRRKTLYTAFERRELPPIGGVRHTFFTFAHSKYVKPGTVLKLEATVAGVGHAERSVRYFRAP